MTKAERKKKKNCKAEQRTDFYIDGQRRRKDCIDKQRRRRNHYRWAEMKMTRPQNVNFF